MYVCHKNLPLFMRTQLILYKNPTVKMLQIDKDLDYERIPFFEKIGVVLEFGQISHFFYKLAFLMAPNLEIVCQI